MRQGLGQIKFYMYGHTVKRPGSLPSQPCIAAKANTVQLVVMWLGGSGFSRENARKLTASVVNMRSLRG